MPGVTNSTGRKNCIVGARPSANTSSFIEEVPVDKISTIPSNTLLRSAASLQRQKQNGLKTLRTCSDSGCGWTKPVFNQPSEQNIAGGSRNLEVRSKGCRGCGKDSRSWIRVDVSEEQSSKDKEPQERGENADPYLSYTSKSKALPRAVILKPKLVLSLPGVQPAKKKKQLIVLPEPPPIKDAMVETDFSS